MRLVNSDGNEISGNRLLGNKYSGMFLYASDNNQIAGNNASINSQNGISLLSCSENTIHDNTVDGNADTGIWLNLSNDNQLYQNNISNNPTGLDVMHSTGNRAFHNNFLGNVEHSKDTDGSNSWDEGNVTGGNYWEDHVAKGNPSQNWPRMIKGGGMMDNYPFQDESGWLKAAAAISRNT
jgi:parallel beta-helix repeat protein